MNLWLNIEYQMVKKRLKQADLARKMGITPQNFNNIKRKNNPSLKTLTRIADALEVPIRVFFEDEV